MKMKELLEKACARDALPEAIKELKTEYQKFSHALNEAKVVESEAMNSIYAVVTCTWYHILESGKIEFVNECSCENFVIAEYDAEAYKRFYDFMIARYGFKVINCFLNFDGTIEIYYSDDDVSDPKYNCLENHIKLSAIKLKLREN